MKRFLKDRRGIEGLPMKLIIIVVIAAAVLAAVLAMLGGFNPEASMEVDYDEIVAGDHTRPSEGFLVKVDATGSEEVTEISFTAHIDVTDSGDGKSIDGAKVTITGANGAGSGTTDDGHAEVTVEGCRLPANTDTLYLKVKVTKGGYHDVVDEEGLQLQRV